MALNSRGSQFLYDSGSGLAVLEECKNIAGPDGSAATIETTHLGSSAKEYLADFPDFGDINLTCNFTGDTVQMDLFDAFKDSADPAPALVRIPQAIGSSDYHNFAVMAIVTKWSVTAAVGAAAQLTVTVHVTGAPSYSAT